MNATALLAELEGRGIRVLARGGKVRLEAPPGTITEDVRQAVLGCKSELLAVLSGADPEVGWRVEAMRPQVPVRGGLPFLTARRDFVDTPGCCLSCGEPLIEGRRYRCAPCQTAVELLLNEVREGVET